MGNITRTQSVQVFALSCAFLSSVGCASEDEPVRGFVNEVSEFAPGDGAGYGSPSNVLGPPSGGGSGAGGLDVLSLGVGGTIVVRVDPAIVDGPGPDFVVFENPFVFGNGKIFMEPAFVDVSDDGVVFKEFECMPEAEPPVGCAGVRPVLANGDSPFDRDRYEEAGGDAFDLADVGVARASYIRIRDAGLGVVDGITSGFDLDAVAVINELKE